MIITMEVGRIYWKPLRDYLKAEQFRGINLTWMESSGWIVHTFYIKGLDRDVQPLRDTLHRWAETVDQPAESITKSSSSRHIYALLHANSHVLKW